LKNTLPFRSLTEEVQASLLASFVGARLDNSPYRHWTLADVLPPGIPERLRTLPFAPPRLEGVSGKREFHNDQRHYFDAVNIARFDVCAAIAEAFQSEIVVKAIEAATGVDLSGSYLRLEYAQDTDGFWLEPHTDLGVKKFTMLAYLAEPGAPRNLGTDVYAAPGQWVKRSEFVDNTALVFVPGANTWHGLEPRPIPGVRRSLIMNYVTAEWRAREQLSYPETPVRA
jgi:hypothetical protein